MNTMGQVRKVLVVAMVLLATVAGCGRELKAQEVGDYEALRNLVDRYLAENRKEEAFSILVDFDDIDRAVDVANETAILEDYVKHVEKLLDKEPANAKYMFICYVGNMVQGNDANAAIYIYKLRNIFIINEASSDQLAYLSFILSVQYTILGMYDEALQEINIAIRLDPSVDDYYVYKGEILQVSNRNQDFVDYVKANKDSRWSKSVDNIRNLGWAFFRLGQLNDAKKSFDMCILKKGNDDCSYYLYARAYIKKQQGLKESAEKDFYKALKMAEENDNIQVMMRANYYLGEEEKALAIADSVFSADIQVQYYDAICIYALCGKIDRLVNAVNNMYEKRMYRIFTTNDVRYDRDFEKVIGNNDFKKAMKKFWHHYDRDREMLEKVLAK